MLFAFGFFAFSAQAQSSGTFEELGNMIDDAVFFTDKYISPAADAVVYQAASGWVDTPQKKKLWSFTLGLHGNTFFIPHKDRQFEISNDDFKFFHIQGATSATTPTALGNREYVTLEGTLNNKPLIMRTPEGVNREAVTFPYLQGSLGLFYGTELIAKFSPTVHLKTVDYQIYGFGLKHNLSQYFKKIEQKNYHLSVLATYGKEDLTVAFFDVNTDFGSINALNGNIDGFQLQLNGSKTFDWFELMGGFMVNRSDFAYTVKGPENTSGQTDFLQLVLNDNLKSIGKTKVNYLGEISGRCRFYNLFVQTSAAFGKFVNLNYSIQYEF